MLDGKAMAAEVVRTVRDYVARSLEPITARLQEFDARLKALPAPEKGEPGKDADLAAIAELVAAEVAKAVAAIPPAKQGEPGKDAEPIHADTVALMVVTEVAKQLAAIPRPSDGKDGDPGRDAAELVILPAIDKEKSYARGTWASHQGGLWKALTQTDGMTGWQIMVDGVAALVVAQLGDNGRHFTLRAAMASGVTNELAFSVPAMIYRGIWKEGEYERGDTVTRDGSTWHCEVEKTTATPGLSADWKLCVRKGDRGKDGKNGEPGKPGSPGKDLRAVY